MDIILEDGILRGKRELTASDFSLEGRAPEWNAYEECWVYFLYAAGDCTKATENMNEIFGANLEALDSLNVYVRIAPDHSTGKDLVKDELDVTIEREDSYENEEYVYKLSDREKDTLLALVLEREISRLSGMLEKLPAAEQLRLLNFARAERKRIIAAYSNKRSSEAAE